MINTALSSPGPESRFLGRSTLEHVHGILLDEKFLHRSVHAAFVNTKWYEAWLERTLLLDPIIFDMWMAGVLSWAPGQPQSLFRICVVVLSSITSRSVAAAAASSLLRFSPSPSCRGDAANPWLESAFITHFGPSTSSSCSGWASLVSFCSRHDPVKTRSVQDTLHDACSCLTPHVNFSGDRVRGACTCRHPCSASSSNRIRGTCTCCHPRSAFFSDRVRGVRTCCLPCRTSDTD